MPLPIILDFSAGNTFLSLNSASGIQGISYGVLTLPFVSTARRFGDSNLPLTQIQVKGFRAGAREKDLPRTCDSNIRHRAYEAAAHRPIPNRSLPGMKDAAIAAWLRQLLSTSDPDLSYGEERAKLFGLNGYNENDPGRRHLFSDDLNVCFIRTCVGIVESPMLNLLLLGPFPSLFFRDPYEDSGNATLGYLTAVREAAYAYAVLREGTLGNIPVYSGTYIVCT